MTTDEVKAVRAGLGLTQAELAEHLGVDQRQIRRWESGENTSPGYLWRALEHLTAELQKPKRRKAS